MTTKLDTSTPLPPTWAQWKRENDPPGMWTGFSRRLTDMGIADTRIGVGHYELSASQTVVFDEEAEEEPEAWQVAARVDAWAHYDRRVALVLRFDALEYGLEPVCKKPLWPRILTWPDHLVTHAEAYLVDEDPRPWSDRHEREGMDSLIASRAVACPLCDTMDCGDCSG